MQQQRAQGIVTVATTYGLILGVLSFVVFLVGTMVRTRQNWLLSVVNAALLIVLMVLAQRQIRRTHDGMLTYAQGLGSGTLVASAAALVSCVLVYVYAKYINVGYVATLLQAQRAALQQRGITGAQAQQAMAIAAAIRTPTGIAVTSLISGVIMGFIVALIVSIFTQKADPRAVT